MMSIIAHEQMVGIRNYFSWKLNVSDSNCIQKQNYQNLKRKNKGDIKNVKVTQENKGNPTNKQRQREPKRI